MNYLIILIALVSLNVYAQPTANVINQATLGGDNMDYGWSCVHNLDGSILVAGWSVSGISGDKTLASFGNGDIWLLKLNADFSIVWQQVYGGSGVETNPEIISTSDGGYLVGCTSDSPVSGNKTFANVGGEDYWILKLDVDGNIEWQNVYGGVSDDSFTGLAETANGEFVISGSSSSNISGNKTENSYGFADYWIVRIDAAGSYVWDSTIGGSDFDNVRDVVVDANGDIVLSGDSFSGISGVKSQNSFGLSDYWIVKLDAFGNLLWEKAFGGDALDEYCYLTVDGLSYYIVGYSESDITGNKTESNKGVIDFWALKLNQSGTIIWQKSIGGSDADGPESVIITDDFQILIGGFSTSNISGDKSENSVGGSQDFWIVSLDTNSNFNWDKTIGGTQTENMYALLEKSNNNYICFGYSASNISGDKDEVCRGLEDYWIVEISSNVGLNEYHDNSIFIFPNPTLNEVNFSSQVSNVKIVNVQGQLLKQELTHSISKIELGNLEGGIYVIQYDLDGITYSQKITVN